MKSALTCATLMIVSMTFSFLLPASGANADEIEGECVSCAGCAPCGGGGSTGGKTHVYTPPRNPSSNGVTPRGPTEQEINRKKSIELNGYGIAAFKDGDLERAIAFYTEALKYAPYDPVIRANLGIVQNKIGLDLLRYANYQEARSWFERAARNSPDDDAIRENLQLAINRQRESDRTKKSLSAVQDSVSRSVDGLVGKLDRQKKRSNGTVSTSSPGTDPGALHFVGSHSQIGINGSRALREAQAASELGRSGNDGDRIKVWDTQTSFVGSEASPGSDPGVVDARGVEPRHVPEEVKQRRQWQAMNQLQDEYRIQQESIQRTIDAIDAKLESGLGDRGELIVQRSRARQDLSNIDAQIDVIEVQKRDIVDAFVEVETSQSTQFETEQ